MTEFIESSLFVLAVIVFVIVLPFAWLRRQRRARKLSEQHSRQEQKAHFEYRQLHPDFAAFVSHYGCEPPLPLRQLYANRENVLDENFEVILPSGDPYFIAWFEPMDEQEWPDLDGLYSFANDGCGNQFLIIPREADPEVFFNDHETGQRKLLELRLSQFLVAERKR